MEALKQKIDFSEQPTSYLESRLKIITDLSAQEEHGGALRKGEPITRAIVQEYQRRPGHSEMLIALVKWAYSDLTGNLDYTFN